MERKLNHRVNLSSLGVALLASVALVFVFVFAQPEQADALVLMKNYEGTINIALQESQAALTPVALATEEAQTPTALAVTGDETILLVFASLAIMFFASCVIFACAGKTSPAEGGSGRASRKNCKRATFICLTMTILLGCLGSGAFVTKSIAIATGVLDDVTVTSVLKVDSTGTILNNKITVENNTTKDVTINTVNCPSELGTWGSDLVGQTVPAGEELSSTWDEMKLSDDALNSIRLKGGSAEFKLDVNLGFDFDVVKLDVTDQTYEGTRFLPEVTMDELLDEGDYEVTYGDNKNAGTGTVTISGSGDFSGKGTYTFKIAPKTIDVTGILAKDKTYDGKTSLTLDSSAVVFDGVVEGDEVGVEVNGVFRDKNVGTAKPITIDKFTLTGASKGNYVVSDASKNVELSASILAKSITLGGETVAKDKVYDAKVTATIDSSKTTLDGVVEGDDVSISRITGTFADKNAGENKEVTLAVTLGGADLGNYVLGTVDKPKATITKKPVNVTGVVVKDRAYEWKNTDAPLDDTNAVVAESDKCEGDDLYWFKGLYRKLQYENDKAGDNKKVTLPGGALQGSDHDNYTLSEESKYIYGNILVTLKIYTNCDMTVPDQLVHINQKLSKDFESTLPTRKGLKIEGWYSSSACPDDSAYKWDFENDVVQVSSLTLYANWTTDSSAAADDQVYYWISPSSIYTTSQQICNQTNSDYVHEDWHIVKSSHEIQEDVTTMKAEAADGTAGNSGSVTSTYKGYMSGDKYHLYARYPGGETEPSSKTEGSADGAASDENAFAEFRIIEVGQHLNVSGDSTSSDGSILTFMSTHTLPTADQLNSNSEYTDGGWAVTSLRPKLQTGGETFNRFESGFTDDITPVKKLYNKGGGTSVINVKDTPCGETTDQFWIPSYVELYGGGQNEQDAISNTEGTQYAWFSGKVGYYMYMNYALELKTRAGASPGYSCYKYAWWTRSPHTLGVKLNGVEIGAFIWIEVFYSGIPSDFGSNLSDYPIGTALCFCF